MSRVDEDAKAWRKVLAGRIGDAVSALRRAEGMTANRLWERTRELGYPVTAVAISKIENNAREGKVDLAEILVLAAALEVSPLRLLLGDALTEDSVEVLPGQRISGFEALRQFVGLDIRGDMHIAIRLVEVDQMLTLQRQNLYNLTHGPEHLKMSARMAKLNDDRRQHAEKQVELLEAERADLLDLWARSSDDA